MELLYDWKVSWRRKQTNLTEMKIIFTTTVWRHSGVHRNFVWGGIQQIQFRTEDRENMDLGQ